MGNVFGRRFRVTTWGESHGPAMGAVVDGCPAGVSVDLGVIQNWLNRDVPDVELGTSRSESNGVQVLSGVFEGKTIGTPVCLMVENTGVKSHFYERLRHTVRPGHGDLTYLQRFGVRDWRGGSRASGRECIARLAAAGLAEQLLEPIGFSVSSEILELASIRIKTPEDLQRARKEAIRLKDEGDSSGGMVRVTLNGLPAGLGGPVFGKFEAELGAAILGIGGVRSFAIGAGCRAARVPGSQFNDAIVVRDDRIGTDSNRAGGVMAGITNGEPVWFDFAVKPTPSINVPQQSVDLRNGDSTEFSANGHFDANFTPRAAVVAEAMATLLVADHMIDSGFIHPTRYEESPLLPS